MSGGLAPSKSTVYVSNLPFSFTNNDLHKLFEKYGKVVKVTIMKDKNTRKSKGVAFVLYLDKDSAQKAVNALDGKKISDRTVKCSIAHDNGRASEFIRKKVYADKTRCFECGDEGHLSYRCPKNALGDREPPKKKEKKRKRRLKQEETAHYGAQEDEGSDDNDDGGEDPSLESLSAAIRYQQEKVEEEEYRFRVATGNYAGQGGGESASQAKKRFKPAAYFSDEEDVSD